LRTKIADFWKIIFLTKIFNRDWP